MTLRSVSLAVVSAVWASMSAAGSMTFDYVGNGGNCYSCAWVSAVGEITPQTPATFEAFLSQSNNQDLIRNGVYVIFQSQGGDLGAAFEFGRLLRENDASVSIGNPIPLEGTSYFNLDPGECLSACAYAFLGAQSREIDDGNMLGFHQFFDDAVLQNIAEPSFTGAERLQDQYVVGLIINYLIEMDISTELYPLIAATPPGEMMVLTPEQAGDLKIVKSGIGNKWELQAMGRGLVAESRTALDEQLVRVYCAGPNDLHLTYYFKLSRDSSTLGTDIVGLGSVAPFTRNASRLVFKTGKPNQQDGSNQNDAGSGHVVFNRFVYQDQQEYAIYDFSLPMTAAASIGQTNRFVVELSGDMARIDIAYFSDFSFSWRGSAQKEMALITRNCL